MSGYTPACAGLGDIRLHDLRHSFAATGAASNLGLPIIGKLLGHKRAETTSRYAHIAHPLPFYPKAQIRQGADRVSVPTRRCRIDGSGLATTHPGWQAS
jgi:hypothetical protein